MSNNKGFTLVELLVVIAIIAILSVIGLALFTGAQQSARDARRKNDIDAIAVALETKKQAGTINYSPLVNTSFSSGSIPADTTDAKYCIKLYMTDGGAKADPNPTNAFNQSGCPDGTAVTGEYTVWYPATEGGGFISTNWPASVNVIKSWKLCAKLEASSGVYCRNSAQ
ncbi:type II secretion system protein [Candidatus Daviesbacteria bacterium]|nr:type II secretion system protein [Candidatus Daviesbacteria bacterium]